MVKCHGFSIIFQQLWLEDKKMHNNKLLNFFLDNFSWSHITTEIRSEDEAEKQV